MISRVLEFETTLHKKIMNYTTHITNKVTSH